MTAFYNEIEPYAADWLRNLIAAGHIAPGVVDERSIIELDPDELRQYRQCHFFAGIGGWSYALRLAGWPDDRPVWTGSCPCQPFSVAGAQRGSDDERHLWPAFFNLIRECRPATVFGEQVAGAAGLAWLDHVCADLEESGYAVAAADLPACSVGAPHRRQRLWWVADADGGNTSAEGLQRSGEQRLLAASGGVSRMADDDRAGRGLVRIAGLLDGERAAFGHDADRSGADDRMGNSSSRGFGIDGSAPRQSRHTSLADATGIVGDTDDARPQGCNRSGDMELHGGSQPLRSTAETGVLDPWRDLEWLACSDGKARPTQSGLFPLAHGSTARVGRLRAYGNAIVPQVAAEFVRAYLDVMEAA